MYMIFFVLDDPSLLNKVLVAWENAGITGATIVESSGFHRRKKLLHMRYTFDSGMEEEGHTTLFAIVPGEEKIRACLEATEEITGSLDDPHSGVFAAWPLTFTKGIPAQDMQQ